MEIILNSPERTAVNSNGHKIVGTHAVVCDKRTAVNSYRMSVLRTYAVRSQSKCHTVCIIISLKRTAVDNEAGGCVKRVPLSGYDSAAAKTVVNGKRGMLKRRIVKSIPAYNRIDTVVKIVVLKQGLAVKIKSDAFLIINTREQSGTGKLNVGKKRHNAIAIFNRISRRFVYICVVSYCAANLYACHSLCAAIANTGSHEAMRLSRYGCSTAVIICVVSSTRDVTVFSRTACMRALFSAFETYAILVIVTLTDKSAVILNSTVIAKAYVLGNSQSCALGNNESISCRNGIIYSESKVSAYVNSFIGQKHGPAASVVFFAEANVTLAGDALFKLNVIYICKNCDRARLTCNTAAKSAGSYVTGRTDRAARNNDIAGIFISSDACGAPAANCCDISAGNRYITA